MSMPTREATLILVPTEIERQHLLPQLSEHYHLQLCGFGPIVSGIEATGLLAGGNFQNVILTGIAGTYDSRALPVGSACSFRQVGYYGVGAGEGPDHQSARDMGKEQPELENGVSAYDPLSLTPAAVGSCSEELLTVATAASNDQQVEWRRDAFPHAAAEDMEGFAVALAAAKFSLSVTVIRGISNEAGDRDHSAWEIGPAMRAAGDLLMQHLAVG
jgi:futalosine hydrolase